MSAQEAHNILALPDVAVTNQSDKQTQPQKFLQLNSVVQQKLKKYAQQESALQNLARAIADQDASALKNSVNAGRAGRGGAHER